MYLPRLPKDQAIKHYHAGHEMIVFDMTIKKRKKFNNTENSELSLSDLNKNSQLIFFLNAPKEYETFETTRMKQSIYYTIGLLPLILSTGFFMAYAFDIPLRFSPDNKYASLIIALILSYIGSHFAIKLSMLPIQSAKEFKNKFFL